MKDSSIVPPLPWIAGTKWSEVYKKDFRNEFAPRHPPLLPPLTGDYTKYFNKNTPRVLINFRVLQHYSNFALIY